MIIHLLATNPVQGAEGHIGIGGVIYVTHDELDELWPTRVPWVRMWRPHRGWNLC